VRVGSINLSPIEPQSTGNRGMQGYDFVNFHCKNINYEADGDGL
jgi:hypothetical protein